MSGYVLARVLPSAELALAQTLERLAEPGVDHRSSLEDFASLLDGLSPTDLSTSVPAPDPGRLSPVLANSVAALVETAAHDKGVPPPEWVRSVPPLTRPHFGWTLRSLRPHQVRVSPIPFKRRNIFFDPATGASP